MARQFVRALGGEQIWAGGLGWEHYTESMSFAPDIFHALHFMLRLLADYFGAPPYPLGTKGRSEPIFLALFDVWRHPDPEVLAPACLAALDFHTWRWAHKEWGPEFWHYHPIEILLLFRLRKDLGLTNPVLDHPLMNTPLGVLPEEVPCDPAEDDLLRRVRARMEQDGFDEAAILASVFPNGVPEWGPTWQW